MKAPRRSAHYHAKDKYERAIARAKTSEELIAVLTEMLNALKAETEQEEKQHEEKQQEEEKKL